MNNYTGALLSCALHEYFTNNTNSSFEGDTKVYKVPKTINVAMPFSIRDKPKSVDGIKMVNDFAPVYVTMPLCQNMSEGIKVVSKEFNSFKGSLEPFGMKALSVVSAWLPFSMP